MKKLISAVAGAVALAGTASAGNIYEYTNTNINQATNAGQIESLFFSYNSDELLGFSATLSNTVSQAAWFVLSPGANPRHVNDELAILYLDYAGGDVYAYQYNGQIGLANSGSQSYNDPGAFVAVYEDVLSVDTSAGTTELSFSDLDVSALAPGTFSADWTGVSFDENIGIWAHFAAVDAFAADPSTGVTAFVPTLQSWYDALDRTAVAVSEPAGLALAGVLGVFGVAAYRRRKAAASA